MGKKKMSSHDSHEEDLEPDLVIDKYKASPPVDYDDGFPATDPEHEVIRNKYQTLGLSSQDQTRQRRNSTRRQAYHASRQFQTKKEL